jgi:hypothetical protein
VTPAWRLTVRGRPLAPSTAMRSGLRQMSKGPRSRSTAAGSSGRSWLRSGAGHSRAQGALAFLLPSRPSDSVSRVVRFRRGWARRAKFASSAPSSCLSVKSMPTTKEYWSSLYSSAALVALASKNTAHLSHHAFVADAHAGRCAKFASRVLCFVSADVAQRSRPARAGGWDWTHAAHRWR